MPKLFFALQPGPELLQQIVQVRDPLQLPGRLCARNKLHLTLLYLGQASVNQLQAFVHCASNIAIDRFELGLDYLDCFKNNHIVWMGCSKIPDGLTELQQALVRCGAKMDWTMEKRRFKPHITLARRSILEGRINLTPMTWSVKHFYLFESRQTHDGVVYQALNRFELN